MCSMDEVRIAWTISARSESEPEGCVRDNRVRLDGGGAIFDVRREVKPPEGPASSGEQTRESIFLEVVIVSRMRSARTSSSIGAGSGPG